MNCCTSGFAAKAKPAVAAPLDPGFCLPVLFEQAYLKGLQKRRSLILAIEREDGCISRREIIIAEDDSEINQEETIFYVERMVKFMLWSFGGWRLYIGGPEWIGRRLTEIYSAAGQRSFDVELMERVYEKTFEVVACTPEEVPPAVEKALAMGGHLDGCRIGFDLGASDYKLAAVRDGEPVFTTEIPWDPVSQEDPEYHLQAIQKGLRMAAEHLPRVDAIGGSAAGVYVNNRPMVASLFRSVPEDQYEAKVKTLFQRLGDPWGVPLTVINDGDVTALAGALSLKKSGMLGIAMGSSEAVGFLNPQGRVTGQLNELAFAPVDFNPQAAADEWSGDVGVGALYFSQQAVNRLAPAAGFSFPPGMGLPERLQQIQASADADDPAALRIFTTIGVYLGYTLPWYRRFYDYENVLVLGRVTSGKGGERLLTSAREVLTAEFPEFARQLKLHVPDEQSRRVGQAVAAASLPMIEA